VPQQGIAVQTDGTELVFGSSLKQDAKKFIAAVLTKAVVEIR
jgi:ABC-type Fe3+ transport system substrate-binding protein